MTLSLHAVRNATPSTASDTLSSETQFLKQPSNYGRNRWNLFYRSCRSRSTDLKSNKIVARPPPRVFKHVESCSPYIEHTNLSCGNRLVPIAAMYGHPCLTTYYSSTLFNSKEKNWKRKHQRSSIHSPSIMRCETEWRGQGDMPSEQITSGHEGHDHCGERKCKRDHPHSEHEHGVRECKKGQRDTLHNSDHTADQRECGHEHCEHVREWRGVKDAYCECARRREAGHDQHHEGSEWKGRRDMHPEYTPGQGEREDELGRASSHRVAKKGYFITVSKELMGLFCYIKKRKRSTIKELADTLRQVAAVAVVLTCVRGILAPLVEVFKTTPPTWSKLLLMLVSLDSVAMSYLTIKAVEPLEQLAGLATENRADIMVGVEKEAEMMVRIAAELIRLFKRLRNIAISVTVSQTVQLLFAVLKLQDPAFVAHCSRVAHLWLLAPWT